MGLVWRCHMTIPTNHDRQPMAFAYVICRRGVLTPGRANADQKNGKPRRCAPHIHSPTNLHPSQCWLFRRIPSFRSFTGSFSSGRKLYFS